MSGQVTAAVAATAGGVREAGQAGPGWPELYACQREGPPYPV